MDHQQLHDAALAYHEKPIPGKIKIEITKPAETAEDLTLAYSPGVAEPVREIAKNPADAYRYTGKGNSVAGERVLRHLSQQLHLHIFDADSQTD